jgi:hypothetical protein
VSKWGFLGGGSRRRHVAALLTVVGALAISALALFTQAGAASQSKLVSVERAGAAPVGSTALGAPSATASQSGDVVLKPRDPAALQSFVSALTTKSSSEYHKYLAGGAFKAQFGPTQATIDSVEATLKGDGLKVSGVTSNGMMVSFSGNTAQVESAFNTKLENYKTPAGVTGEEAVSAIELPSTISPDVTGVIGLDNTLKATDSLTKGTAAQAAKYPKAKTADITDYPTGSPQPCTDASTAASEFGGLTDDQIANAYGAFGEYSTNDTGAGVHVGVYELEPFLTSDLQTFDSCYFGATQAASMVNDQLTINNVDGGPGSGSGSGEAILDVEDVSAMAPGADIDVYQAPNSIAGGLEAYESMVDTDVDKVITSSWGFCEADEQIDAPGYQQSEYYVFEQAAAQGQTVLNATGDTGNDSCDEVRSVPPPTDQQPLSVGDPAAQPYVMAVGGTTIQDADPANFDETVWNDGADWGGGNGGISNTWAAPSWQTVVSGFPEPGGSVYTDADNVLEDSGTNGLSEPGEPWDTPGAAEFCATNTNLPAGTPCRTLPDVSAQADEFTGAVTIYQVSEGGWLTIGGTSSATPIWAGMLALVDASQPCQADGVPVAQGIGFAPPELYAVAANASEYAESFHDTTVGNNDVYDFDNGESFPATTGYDLATGLGSPILTNPDGTPGLAANLCAIAGTTTPPPSITTLAPASGPVAGGTTERVTLASALPTGTTVTAVSVGNALITSGITATGTSVSFTLPAGTASLANPTTTTSDDSTDTTFSSAGSEGSQDGAGPAEITVTLSNGQSTQLSPTSLYEYVDQTGGNTTPTVTGLEPYAGLESAPTQVTVYGSGFDVPAAGATTTDEVLVGSVVVPPADVDVISPYELKVTPPAYSSSTNCPTKKALTKETGDTNPAADDICQTNIRVEDTATGNESATSPPNPAYEGLSVAVTQDGLPEVPTGFELAPSPTEFDYIPTPEITSVNADGSNSSSDFTPVTTADPSTLADASGGSIVLLTGQGLNPLTLDYFLVGDPTLNSSIDFSLLFYAGNEAVIELPADPNVAAGDTIGTQPDSVPITASTVAGNSAPADAIYAGIPTVSSVSTGQTDAGYAVGPDAGGTGLTVTGAGFSDVTGPLQFVDNVTAAEFGVSFSVASQYTYTVNSDTGLTTTTPETNPAILDTEACTNSGCSAPVTADQVLEYPPGDPQITSIDTTSGPADGGTTVTITGENLGCVTSVEFGGVEALAAANVPELLDCGSTSSVTVVAPPGTAGSTVPITLTTVESDEAGTSATSPTSFTYEANPSASPSPEDFGSVDVGSSNIKTVTITNPGAGDLDLDAATITGDNASQFTITTDGCSDATIGAGESCTEAIQFAPTSSGTQNATLDIPFNSSPTDLTASLTGTGTIPSSTVTQTVTGPATTVTTPGPTTTVTTPGTTTTTLKTYTCKVLTKYTTKTVTKKYRVKVKGKYVTRTKKVRERVAHKSVVCSLTKVTTTVKEQRAAATVLARSVGSARLRFESRTRAASAKKARTAVKK